MSLKTDLIFIAILAMRYNRLTIFLGSIVSLIVMTVISALVGFGITSFIPPIYTYYAAIVIEGKGRIDNHIVRSGDALIITSGTTKISIEGNMRIIVSYPFLGKAA